VGTLRPASRIVGVAVSVGLVVGALAPSSAAAPVTSRARSVLTCAREPVDGGKFFGRLTLRFGLVGRVSCAKAHRLARAYFHKVATGQCGKSNNFCDLSFGGWACSIFFATEVTETGGARAGCAQVRGEAKVRFYWGKSQAKSAEAISGRSGPRARPAAAGFRNCGTFRALHVGIQAQHVSCAMSRRIVKAYLQGKRVGAGVARVEGFPAWSCSTGDRLGTCAKGKIASGGPEIAFFYLQQRR
jgi:hypothetical protein